MEDVSSPETASPAEWALPSWSPGGSSQPPPGPIPRQANPPDLSKSEGPNPFPLQKTLEVPQAFPRVPQGCQLSPPENPQALENNQQGGQSVTHTGPPIVVTLANTAVTFSCNITYPYTSKFKDFTVSYYHIDLQGQRSAEEQTACRAHPGKKNQTYSLKCQVTPKLPDSSATGTYYCYVHWPDYEDRSSGPFILVRDTGYREPPQIPRKPLLIVFTSLLTVVSVLGTALLFWKKKQMQTPGKHSPEKRPDPKSASSPKQPPAESVYTALQRRETEVYACIESEDTSLPSTQSPFSQENPHQFEDDSEFNLVYENL
ncbi:NFAT activation molecule 1 [Cynocephalus volans]|uniref:NFAT activation molecule 1 n=1 Tax=Cynocephalus volans TaxID=110931 RepID=UPI002FCC2330